MDVDYLLFHEDKKKVDDLVERLSKHGTFLFRGFHRFLNGYLMRDGERYFKSWDVKVREISRLGENVLGYNVTLENCEEYPELVAVTLIEKGWRVKVRYRTGGGTWEYVQSEFPDDCVYAHPDGWRDWSV
jgi:hypothetical protein